MTSHTDKAGAAGPSGATDPGIRLLALIGDFIEPLTRFSRASIAMEASRHERVNVALRQEFRVALEVKHLEGPGPLPAGALSHPDAAAADRASASQLAAARAGVAPRLAEWAQAHGENPLARPGAPDVFSDAPAIGHVQTCPSCNGAGRLPCVTCNAAGAVACAACEARGSAPCKSCQASGKVRCTRCYGMGYQLRDKPGAGPERIPCTGCGGTGSNACEACRGRGQIVCQTCHGQKKVPCPTCRGSGSKACELCEGAGKRHVLARLGVAVTENLMITPDPAGKEVSAVLATLKSVEQVMDLAGSHRASAEVSGMGLSRQTIAVFPVTTLDVMAGGQRTQVHGYGRGQMIRDYANVAGMLVADDLARLATVTPAALQLPPRTSPDLEAALADVLASPVNVTIAEGAAEARLDAVEQTLRGSVSGEQIRRTAAVARRAVGDVYWSHLARWPALVLALPLLQLPIALLLRGQGDGSRAMATIGVMLVALGGAISAHMWCAMQLQKRLAPDGAPRITLLLDRLKLTRSWMIAAGAWAFLSTLVIAGIAGALFPPSG